jgi:hypothetical protein
LAFMKSTSGLDALLSISTSKASIPLNISSTWRVLSALRLVTTWEDHGLCVGKALKDSTNA